MKRPAVMLAFGLFIITSALLLYRIMVLGYPIFPAAPGRAFLLKFEGHVKSSGSNTTLFVALPSEKPGQIISEEYFGSGSLSFTLTRNMSGRYGVWTGQTGPDGEIASYREMILMRPSGTAKLKPPALEKYPSSINKNDQATAERITGRFQSLPLPGRIRSILQFVRDIREKPLAEGREREFLERMEGKYDRSILPLTLFRAALIPARIIEGIRLTEGITTRPLTWIDVWNGRKWESVSIDGKEILKDQASLLTLTSDGKPIVDVSGGEISDVRWDINRQIVGQWRLNYEHISRSDRFLDRWSLFRLPAEFQQTFRILLLVPIGALLICILRNIIGFPTFGIFMPVLMALSFRNTGLVYGLAIFAGVILIGYAARRLLDRLRLLLVPRMSVLLTLVIVCFTLLALFGNKLGLRQVMAVGLLPFVILVMTIERFFVVVEEHGARTALQTAAGSAAVACITYLIISWETLQLTFFIYPELLLAVGALQMLVGRYTGYRLSELFRFREFHSPS
ncbi:MAG: 7TM domain-containing protein [Syntrophorhabdaceae bacterium]|nr:7TM domain-containing protein [Syntrophorhabdaceae bacterium]MDD5244886.1 7TM domain-containing protein [Syntrophorhabdaceae bacterium]